MALNTATRRPSTNRRSRAPRPSPSHATADSLPSSNAAPMQTRRAIRNNRAQIGRLVTRPARLQLAVAIARFLAAETQAAWPHLDASTTVLSLFATWLTARGKLENWLYWIVVDAVQAWLYAAQGLVFTAFLFLVYLVIASVGFIEWSKTYRRQTVDDPRIGLAAYSGVRRG